MPGIWLEIRLDYRTYTTPWSNPVDNVNYLPLTYNGEVLPDLWGLFRGQPNMGDVSWAHILHATEQPANTQISSPGVEFCTIDRCWGNAYYTQLVYDFSVGRALSIEEFEALGELPEEPRQTFQDTNYLGRTYSYSAPSARWFFLEGPPEIGFTENADIIDFNSVVTGNEIWVGSPYSALGGNDHVILPSEANAQLIVDSTGSSVFSYTGGLTFNAGSGDDLIDGSHIVSAYTSLVGGVGQDTISGGGGDDRIFGHVDDDTLIGGSGGHNELHGGDGIDTSVFPFPTSTYRFHVGTWVEFMSAANAPKFSVQTVGEGGLQSDQVWTDVENQVFSGRSVRSVDLYELGATSALLDGIQEILGFFSLVPIVNVLAGPATIATRIFQGVVESTLTTDGALRKLFVETVSTIGGLGLSSAAAKITEKFGRVGPLAETGLLSSISDIITAHDLALRKHAGILYDKIATNPSILANSSVLQREFAVMVFDALRDTAGEVSRKLDALKQGFGFHSMNETQVSDFYSDQSVQQAFVDGLQFTDTQVLSANQQLQGTSTQLNNTLVQNFTPNNSLLIQNAIFGAQDVSVTLGSAILDIDTNQDIEPDLRIVISGNFYGSEFRVQNTAEGTEISITQNHVEDFGTEGDDRLLGSNLSDTLFGDNGEDTIIGGDGDDAIDGEADDDFLVGDDGHDLIGAGSGDDVLMGGAGSDTMFGGSGHDGLQGDTGNDALYGDGFNAGFARNEADQVYRLYVAALGREPDFTGHSSWTQALALESSSLSAVAAGFVGSQEFEQTYGTLDNAGFVTLMYNNVLGRNPEAAGLASWIDQLDNGALRSNVLLGFSESVEFRAGTDRVAGEFAQQQSPSFWSDDVFRLYQATLDRAPDLSGFLGWTENLSFGGSYDSVATGFVASVEFQNTYGALEDRGFVNLLYNNVLNRDADADGLAGWLAQLSGGASRESVVQGFAQSQEFINTTADSLKSWIRSQGIHDELEGGAGTNGLAGGILADRFIFDTESGGTHTVLDLEAWDLLAFQNFGYATTVDVRSHMTQEDAEVVFADQGVTIVLENTTLGELTDDMFQL